MYFVRIIVKIASRLTVALFTISDRIVVELSSSRMVEL